MLYPMRCLPGNPMRWDPRHDRGMTRRGRGHWTGDVIPVQRNAVEVGPLIQVCAVLQGELIHLRALVDCGLNLFPYHRTLHHVVGTMVGKVVV